MPSPARLGLALSRILLGALLAQALARGETTLGEVVATGLSPALTSKSLAEFDRDLAVNSAAFTVNVVPYFTIPNLKGGTHDLVQFKTNLGVINAELLADGTDEGEADHNPHLSVANFKSYLATGTTSKADLVKTYDGSIFHLATKDAVIVGGGFRSASGLPTIAPKTAVANEFHYHNTAGTIAFAKTENAPNSATSQWFINLADNSATYNTPNGGYTVFARILGDGLKVAKAIGDLPTYNLGQINDRAFQKLPLIKPELLVTSLVTVESVRIVPLQPPSSGKGASVLNYTLTNDNPSVVTATLTNGILSVTPGTKGGQAILTVRAAEGAGASVDSTITLRRNGPPLIVKELPKTTTLNLGTDPGSLTLTADITAYPFSIKWQRRTSPTAAWSDIAELDSLLSGATTEYLRIKLDDATSEGLSRALDLADDQIRFILTGVKNGVPATVEGQPTTLRVNAPFAFAKKLAATTTGRLGDTVTLSATATDATFPVPTYQWEHRATASSAWEPVVNAAAAQAATETSTATPAVASPYSGAKTATLTIRLNGETPAKTTTEGVPGITTLQTLALDKHQYRCVMTQDRVTTPRTLASTITTLRVTTLKVGVAVQPAKNTDVTLSSVLNATPTATVSVTANAAAANTPLSFQWEARAPGATTWVPLVNDTAAAPTPYLGVTTAKLTISFPSEKNLLPNYGLALEGTDYRCVITNVLKDAPAPFGPAGGKATSGTSKLRVFTGSATLVTPASFRFLGSPAPEANRTFAATGLPAGLAINPTTGVITGTATKAGTYRVTLTTTTGTLATTTTYNLLVVGLFNNVATGFEALLQAGDQPPAAKLSLLISGNGTFTGTLATAVEKNTLAVKGSVVRDAAGTLSLKPNVDVVIARPGTPKGQSYVVTDLAITAAGQFTVKLKTRATATAAPVDFVAATTEYPGTQLAAFSASNPAPWSEIFDSNISYTFAFVEPTAIIPEGASPHPHGSGYGYATVSSEGILSLRGKLPDGTLITASLGADAAADYRLFLRPYDAAGAYFSALIDLSPASAHALVSGTLKEFQRYSVNTATNGLQVYWNRPAGVTSPPAYTAGFGPLGLSLRMEPYYRNSNADIGFTFATEDAATGTITLALAGAGTDNAAPNGRSLPTKLAVTAATSALVDADLPDTSEFTGQLDGNTGLITGSFYLTDTTGTGASATTTKRKVPFEGVFLIRPEAFTKVSESATTLIGVAAGSVTAEGFTLVPALPGTTPSEATTGKFELKK